jgi:HEAT repeat protein
MGRLTFASLALCLAAAAQTAPYEQMDEHARREQIMEWASKPDASACQSIEAGLADPSADIRLRAANALYWKCDRGNTGQTAAQALCRSVDLGNAHAGAWLLLGYAKPEIAKACLQKPVRKGAMVKLAPSTKPLPAEFAARVALARLGDPDATAALREAFENPSLDEALFLLAALRDIDDPAALEAALKLLDDNTRQAPGPDSHSTRTLRNVALEALVDRFQLKPSFAVDAASRYSDAEVDEVRKVAGRAVAALKK